MQLCSKQIFKNYGGFSTGIQSTNPTDEANSRKPNTRDLLFIQHFVITPVYLFYPGARFHPSPSLCPFLLFFAIFLWVSEAIPPFAVGIMIVGFLVFFLGNPMVYTEYHIEVMAFVNTWSDSVIWLLLGGFFLAEAMKKTELDKALFKLSSAHFGTRAKYFLLGQMLSTAIASMFISNTATTAMMFVAIMPLLKKEGVDSHLSKALVLGIPGAAALGGMGTIIGSPTNAIAVDMINNLPNSNYELGFLEWMYFGLPVAILLILVLWLALLQKYPLKDQAVDIDSLLAEKPEDDKGEGADYSLKEKDLRKKIVLIILGLTVLLWLTDKIHPIPIAAVSGIPIIGLTMLSIITNEDVRKLPWDTLMLVAGGLSLGLAIQETGLSQQFVDMIKGFDINALFLILIFAIATVFFSNIMSNTATVTIMVPAASLMPGVDTIQLALVIGLCASCALFLPVSTPPNAIAFSTGLVKQSQFRLGGTLIGLGGPILIMLWVLLVL